MSRFTIFGFLPIAFNDADMWDVDTGSATLNKVAGCAVRVALKVVDALEASLDIVIPIKLVPLDEPGPSKLVPA